MTNQDIKPKPRRPRLGDPDNPEIGAVNLHPVDVIVNISSDIIAVEFPAGFAP